MNNLKSIWYELTSRYTDSEKLIAELWAEIKKNYSNKKRHYHNLKHLEYTLDKAYAYKDNLNDLDTVLFSLFYHDLIYNAKGQDNEQNSAEMARDRLTRLGVPSDKIVNCVYQIMATKDHKKSSDNDTNYVLDFDLAILGDSPENYLDYTQNIRKEYAIYPDFLYKKKRKKVLQHFLDKERIYNTAVFLENFEQQARANLKAELKGL